MKHIDYEQDINGEETLHALANAVKFNAWMYETFSRFVGKRVVEIGAGIGNITDHIQADAILATDLSHRYVKKLQEKYARNSIVKVQQLDLCQENISHIIEWKPDTVICLNVVEHIEDDVQALKNIYNMLQPSGKAIILVPFSQFLYCHYDSELGHFRRYSAATLTDAMIKAGFKVEKTIIFNLFGGLGWLVTGKIFRQKQLSNNLISLYEKLVPLFRIIEKAGIPFGASVIAIGQK